jgi:hypothetical protein
MVQQFEFFFDKNIFQIESIESNDGRLSFEDDDEAKNKQHTHTHTPALKNTVGHGSFKKEGGQKENCLTTFSSRL